MPLAVKSISFTQAKAKAAQHAESGTFPPAVVIYPDMSGFVGVPYGSEPILTFDYVVLDA